VLSKWGAAEVIDAIQSVAHAGTLSELATGHAAAPDRAMGFAETLEAGLRSVEGKISNADSLVQAYATGGDVAIHDVAIALEQARIAVDLAAEVRTKLLDSYREIMNMQV